MLIRDQYWRPLEAPVISSIMNDLRKTQLPELDFRLMLKRRGTPSEEIEDIIAQLSEEGALSSVSAQPTYLFSMDSQLQDELAEGRISQTLVQEFDKRGFFLRDPAIIPSELSSENGERDASRNPGNETATVFSLDH